MERLACKSILDSSIAAAVSALTSVSIFSLVELFRLKYFSSTRFSDFSKFLMPLDSISCDISSLTQ